MKYKVYVDGQEGTTGLLINDRLKIRDDIELLKIDPEKRKDTNTRKNFLNKADIVFLCLPDAAAKESVAMVTNEHTKIIDASTAHRTNPDWAYGLPELGKEYREAIKASKRISVPGCHATGFNVAVHPLTKEGILAKDYPVTAHSITGYSGGGKNLIAKYEETDTDSTALKSPNFYSLGLNHKHLPEMQKVSGLTSPPLFTPVVSNFYKGMLVAVPLLKSYMKKPLSAKEVQAFLANYYMGEPFIEVIPYDSSSYLFEGFLNSVQCNDSNKLQLFVFGNDEQTLVVSRFDNLGKGSSGAAIQNMNLLLGKEEWLGL
ncbi:N-acetyl-gamma-glutamyl-phosphate reductase [Anaerocolumna cellulosilytica]|uniref:N-acetyl-gamma-glutamyl-phosphate reductase n=1 Tax=Anaerocolumna cellulosilytica TaxID=433286 RepID=A0A6S6QUC7_9FIRM|nr:N-acetyl-gamma-glutamyl-phosphate reductase [Anaerocolumna cellulosilytica]MBB5194333.1 N-acetyl-gamma-glutamyl-phosphate reductase [Anaerocolumna cellulosilytica]BCJ93276.1 N-acetyl-gamma-glutamyl-phosphate reductase [Anaerocolumna cellulosilytica]